MTHSTENDALAQHLGGKANAEDCPACEVEQRDLPYPWLCPGGSGTSVIPPAETREVAR